MPSIIVSAQLHDRNNCETKGVRSATTSVSAFDNGFSNLLATSEVPTAKLENPIGATLPLVRIDSDLGDKNSGHEDQVFAKISHLTETQLLKPIIYKELSLVSHRCSVNLVSSISSNSQDSVVANVLEEYVSGIGGGTFVALDDSARSLDITFAHRVFDELSTREQFQEIRAPPLNIVLRQHALDLHTWVDTGQREIGQLPWDRGGHIDMLWGVITPSISVIVKSGIVKTSGITTLTPFFRRFPRDVSSSVITFKNGSKIVAIVTPLIGGISKMEVEQLWDTAKHKKCSDLEVVTDNFDENGVEMSTEHTAITYLFVSSIDGTTAAFEVKYIIGHLRSVAVFYLRAINALPARLAFLDPLSDSLHFGRPIDSFDMLPGLGESCGNGMKSLASQSDLVGNGIVFCVWDPGISPKTMKLNNLSSGVLFHTWTQDILVNSHQYKKSVCTLAVTKNKYFVVCGGTEKRVLRLWNSQKLVTLKQAIGSQISVELMTIPWLNQVFTFYHMLSVQYDPGGVCQGTEVYLFSDSDDYNAAQVQFQGMCNAQQTTYNNDLPTLRTVIELLCYDNEFTHSMCIRSEYRILVMLGCWIRVPNSESLVLHPPGTSITMLVAGNNMNVKENNGSTSGVDLYARSAKLKEISYKVGKNISMHNQNFNLDGCTILLHGFSQVVLQVLKTTQGTMLFIVFYTGGWPNWTVLQLSIARVTLDINVIFLDFLLADTLVECGGNIFMIGISQIICVGKCKNCQGKVATESFNYTYLYTLTQKDMVPIFFATEFAVLMPSMLNMFLSLRHPATILLSSFLELDRTVNSALNSKLHIAFTVGSLAPLSSHLKDFFDAMSVGSGCTLWLGNNEGFVVSFSFKIATRLPPNEIKAEECVSLYEEDVFPSIMLPYSNLEDKVLIEDGGNVINKHSPIDDTGRELVMFTWDPG